MFPTSTLKSLPLLHVYVTLASTARNVPKMTWLLLIQDYVLNNFFYNILYALGCTCISINILTHIHLALIQCFTCDVSIFTYYDKKI